MNSPGHTGFLVTARRLAPGVIPPPLPEACEGRRRKIQGVRGDPGLVSPGLNSVEATPRDVVVT